MAVKPSKAIQSGHFKMVKELTSHRKMSKLVCDIKARDNAGRLPRHYIDDDKFEPDEIDYMKRIIGKTKYTSMTSSFNQHRFHDKIRISKRTSLVM